MAAVHLACPVTACHRSRVSLFFRLLPILLACGLSGCAVSYTDNLFTRNRPYRKVRVTDTEGFLIADWIAEGHVWRHGNGYRFKAVQRLSGPPYAQLTKYPQGRKIILNGPNIVVFPCPKPGWLYRLEGF